jgi:hypothetical protein
MTVIARRVLTIAGAALRVTEEVNGMNNHQKKLRSQGALGVLASHGEAELF